MPLLNLPPNKITFTPATAGTVTISYYISPPSNPSKPTVLFLHGFPDSVAAYNSCATRLLSLGYGVLGLDPLGYGGSDKPVPKDITDHEVLDKFAGKNQVDSWIAILDKEGLEKVVVMGHDWGSFMAGKFGMWYPERTLGVILGNIAYFEPTPFDVEKFNEMLLQMTGIEHSGYMKFFAAGSYAAELIKKNPDSFISILYAADGDTWKEDMVPTGKLESWLRAGRTCKTGDFIPNSTIEELRAHIAENGLESALAMYMATAANRHWEHGEKDLPKERYILQPPTLMIATRRDWCTPWMFIENMKNTVKELTLKEVDSGHWTLHEREQEWNDLVVEWLAGKGL